jgi:poly(3-hydroxybutyrate) depolymerase
MKRTFAFAAAATIAGLLAGPVCAQRNVSAGVAIPGRHYELTPYGAGRGQYDDFGSCEWVTQRFWDGHGWRVRRVRVCG